jgi:hypothetical protein
VSKEIYTNRQGAIEKLLGDNKFELIAEVWKNDRLIAGLFCCLEVET